MHTEHIYVAYILAQIHRSQIHRALTRTLGTHSKSAFLPPFFSRLSSLLSKLFLHWQTTALVTFTSQASVHNLITYYFSQNQRNCNAVPTKHQKELLHLTTSVSAKIINAALQFSFINDTLGQTSSLLFKCKQPRSEDFLIFRFWKRQVMLHF